MQTHIDDFRKLDAEILAISVDTVENNLEIATARGFEFPLLSDPELSAISAFGLRHDAGGPWGDIARPATVIVDREGNVVWRDLTENWRVRPRPVELLAVLEGIR